MSLVCGICNDETNKRLYCNVCASTIALEQRLSMLNAMCEVTRLEQQVDAVVDPKHNNKDKPPSANWTKLYETTSRSLANRALATQRETKRVKSATRTVREETDRLRMELAQRKDALAMRKNSVDRRSVGTFTSLRDAVAHQRETVDTLKYETGMKQLRLGRDVCLLFGVKRARRRPEAVVTASKEPSPEPDTVCVLVGSVTVPDLGSIAQNSHVMINTAVERLASLATLLSYYLNVQLPFDICLPQKSHPVLCISHLNSQFSLVCDRRISSFAQHRAKEFETYAMALAMLALCVATLAQTCLGPSDDSSSPQMTPAQVCQLDTMLLSIHSRLNGKAPGDTPRCHTLPCVDAVADYIVSQAYLDIDGHFAEWDVIDKDSISD